MDGFGPNVSANMSGTSRKVKNPLLTAAGVGFPFENYTESPLLVPVTPATPAVLRDDAEVDSFVGQEAGKSQSSAPPCSTVDLSADNSASSGTRQTEESKDSSGEPVKQGYFSSILSSLPNLSLSSTKNENPQNPKGQTTVNRPQEPQLSVFPQEHHGPSTIPAAPLAAFQRTNFPEAVAGNFAVVGSVPAPPPQTFPPVVPVSAGDQVSYRLGNQRRLKYAPPPDLTSGGPKQYLPPTVQSFQPPQSVCPPSVIFNPGTSAEAIYNPALQEEQSNSFQGSRPPSNPAVIPRNSSTDQIPRVSETQPLSVVGLGQQGGENKTGFAPPIVPVATYKPLATRIYQPATPQVEKNIYTPVTISYNTVTQVPGDSTSQHAPQNSEFHWSKSSAGSLSAHDSSVENVSQVAGNKSVPVTSTSVSSAPQKSAASQIGNSPPSEQLSQSSSLQGSFRSSPTGTRAPSTGGLTPQSSYSELSSALEPTGIPVHGQRAIPARIVEPATPQNTPATGFSGFAAFAKERELSSYSDNLGVLLESSNKANETGPQAKFVKDAPPEFPVETVEKDVPGSSRSETIFTPISAAKVYEKLEHLLAEQEEESVSGKSDVVAEIAGNKTNVGEELTKSSLNTTPLLNPETEESTKLPEALEQIDLDRKDSLSEIDLREDSLEPPKVLFTSTEINSVNEKFGALDIQSATSDISAPPQFLETRPPSTVKSDLNVSNPVGSHKPIPCSYFDTVGIRNPVDWTSNIPKSSENPTVILQQGNTAPPASSFFESPVQSIPKHQSVPPQIPVGLPTNLERKVENSSATPVPFISPLSDSSYNRSLQSQPFAQSTTTLNPPVQQPQFYNPTQFMSGSTTTAFQNSDYFSTLTSPAYNEINPQFGNAQGFNANNSAFVPPSVLMTTVPEPTGSATLSPVHMSVNPTHIGRLPSETVPPNFHTLATGGPDKRMQYRPVYQHWFYRREVENKILWQPFSMQDSLHLEEIHNSSEITPETTVATDGGRYDVDILRRQRTPVYWSRPPTEVRRCSWFYKGPTESRYVPYDESISLKLEEEYKQACMTNIWNRRVDISSSEYVTFHSATVLVHYSQVSSPELASSWGTSVGSEDSTYLQGAANRPRVVKRGVDEFNIDEGEPEKVDHLLFLVHGIGSVCDLKFRTVEEVVDDFRSISLQLVQSHYRSASEQGIVNRIEVLPISWHATLHSEDTGIDKKLQSITLESIPKLRHFTNDTLLDILFYTSPVYCQTIVQTVGNEMNRLYALFKERNPSFDGGVYLGGHSLGSLIIFDLLCHQKPTPVNTVNEDEEGDSNSDKEKEDTVESTKPIPPQVLKRRLSKKISYVMGIAGTGQPYIHYPQLNFQPRAFFALGSPVGMFVTVRGIDKLGEDFVLPTCPAFFNVFHPFDPVAYRVEALINPEARKFRPMLIPHHKGRKRMHLELKETMARVGADLKQKLLDSVRSTWNSVYQLAMFHKSDNQALEREIDKVVEEQLHKSPSVSEQTNTEDPGENFKIGKLNGGRRIDYVLQEAPFEYINEYIFAMTSHACYWESEDTMLMMLKEIYGSMGIQTDAQLPQQTLSIERVSNPPSPIPSTTSSLNSCPPLPPIGMDPTAPISGKPIGPPPKTGFVRKT